MKLEQIKQQATPNTLITTKESQYITGGTMSSGSQKRSRRATGAYTGYLPPMEYTDGLQVIRLQS